MTEMTCRQVEDVATEYALGILPAGEARAVSAHVLACTSCRSEIEAIRDVGDRLLDLAPDAEPPLGFEDRVLSAVGSGKSRRHPGRTRWLLGIAAAAAVLAGAGTAAATLTGGHHPAHPAELAGVLRDGGRTVGTVYVGGHPTWVSMSVDHLSLTGPISCQLVTADGKVTTVGTFQLVDGSGTWGAPETEATAHLSEARLVGPSGAVLAQAQLSQG